MQTEQIISVLLSTASLLKTGVQSVLTQSLQDAYNAVKSRLRSKFASDGEALRALEMALEKPGSPGRRDMLTEEADRFDLPDDPELREAFNRLMAALPAGANLPSQHVEITGSRNSVQVAGRDLVLAQRVVHRNRITPDAQHLDLRQRTELRKLLREVVARWPSSETRTAFGAVHRLLQERFNVPSYLLIPAVQFEGAAAYLRQLRASMRSHLLRKNPVTYRHDQYRAIYAASRSLNWDTAKLCAFATAKLELKAAVGSIKELGPAELNRLRILVQRQVGNEWVRAAQTHRQDSD